MLAIPLEPGIADEADFIVKAIHAAAHVSGVHEACNVKVVPTAGRGFHVQDASTVMIVIAGESLRWFSDSWLHEYLWPILKKELNKPSERIMEVLVKAAKRLAAGSSNH